MEGHSLGRTLGLIPNCPRGMSTATGVVLFFEVILYSVVKTMLPWFDVVLRVYMATPVLLTFMSFHFLFGHCHSYSSIFFFLFCCSFPWSLYPEPTLLPLSFSLSCQPPTSQILIDFNWWCKVRIYVPPFPFLFPFPSHFFSPFLHYLPITNILFYFIHSSFPPTQFVIIPIHVHCPYIYTYYLYQKKKVLVYLVLSNIVTTKFSLLPCSFLTSHKPHNFSIYWMCTHERMNNW